MVEALEQGHLGGYAGDVWDPQPAPPDHSRRARPNHAMTPHVSAPRSRPRGATPPARASLMNRPIRDDSVMVSDGEIQSGSYKAIHG